MDTDGVKEALLAELDTVEKELNELGVKNEETGLWEVRAKDIDESATEPDELADRMEDFEEQQEEIDTLQERRHDILRSLETLG